MLKGKNSTSFLILIMAILCFIKFDDWILGEDFLDNSIHTKSRAIRSLISAIVRNKIGYWLVKFVPVVFSFLALNDIIKNIKNDKGK